MENNIFLCKSEISEVLTILRCRVCLLEETLTDITLTGKQRVFCETRLDFLKTIVRKLSEAYETAD